MRNLSHEPTYALTLEDLSVMTTASIKENDIPKDLKVVVMVDGRPYFPTNGVDDIVEIDGESYILIN